MSEDVQVVYKVGDIVRATKHITEDGKTPPDPSARSPGPDYKKFDPGWQHAKSGDPGLVVHVESDSVSKEGEKIAGLPTVRFLPSGTATIVSQKEIELVERLEGIDLPRFDLEFSGPSPVRRFQDKLHNLATVLGMAGDDHLTYLSRTLRDIASWINTKQEIATPLLARYFDITDRTQSLEMREDLQLLMDVLNPCEGKQCSSLVCDQALHMAEKYKLKLLSPEERFTVGERYRGDYSHMANFDSKIPKFKRKEESK